MYKKRLSSNSIKLIAIFAMIIDHIGWAFIVNDTPQGQLIHLLGRITAPIMCYFIVEGYCYTKNFNKYAARLTIFALISHFPYVLFKTGKIFSVLPCSMMFTLLLCLFSILVYEKVDGFINKISFILILILLSFVSDWNIFAILFTLCFYIFKKKKILIFISICIITVLKIIITQQVYQIGILLSLPLLLFLYNGERGNFKLNKYLFYWIYPLNLIIIGVIKYYF